MAILKYTTGLSLFCILIGSSIAQQNTFNGVVSNVDDHQVAGETVDIRTGGTYRTSTRGEFTFSASENIRVNSEVVFHVSNWVVVKPCELRNGRMFLPPPSQDIDIRVVGPNDPRLKDLAFAQALMGCLVEEAVSLFGNSLSRSNAQVILKSASDQDKFLTSKAGEFGMPKDDLTSAVSHWLMMSHDDYDQGLAALYSGQFSKAKELIAGAINSPDGQVVVKRYVPLARAKYELGDAAGAKADLLKVLDAHPNDSIVQTDLKLITLAPPGSVTATVQ